MAQMNDYRNRSAFISERSKSYGVERHNRVTVLAENGKYISGRKTVPVASQGKTSAVTHVKRQAADKLVNGRIQKRHYGNIEKTEANLSEANVRVDNSAVRNNFAASGKNPVQTYSKQAAELKEKLKRDIAADKMNNKNTYRVNQTGGESKTGNTKAKQTAALKDKAKRDIAAGKRSKRRYTLKENPGTNGGNGGKKTFRVENKESADAKRYFDYKKSKAQYEYKKKIYRVKKLEKGYASRVQGRKALASAVSSGKDTAEQIKQGNAVGTAAAPAKALLRQALNKTAAGKFAIKTKEIGNRAAEAAKESNSASEAMYASASKFTSEAAKSAAYAVSSFINEKHKEVKFQKYIKRENEKANKYLAKQIEKINKASDMVNRGEAPEKLKKDIEKFANRADNTEIKQKLEIKKQKINRKLEKKEKFLNEKKKKSFFGRRSGKAKKKVKSAAGKKIMALAASFAVPVCIGLITVVLITALIYKITHPFDYLSKKETDTDGNSSYVQNDMNEREVIEHYHEVMDSAVDEINNEIQTILGTADSYNNTGIIDPEKYANYEQQKNIYDEYLSDSDEYYNNHFYNPESPDYMSPDFNWNPTEPAEDYYYSESELSEKGLSRGPIFEGFEWTDETTDTSVPKGMLYDEMLAALPTDNVKHDMSKFEELNDDIVFDFYKSMGFWQFTNYGEISVACPAGGECCSKLVPYEIKDDKGNVVGQGFKAEEYCPGHFKILLELICNFDLDNTLDNVLQFNDEDKDMYDEILTDIHNY